MQSSQELFFEEFAVRFQIFFKEMASFCEEFVQQQHYPQLKQQTKSRSQFGGQRAAGQQTHSRRRKEPVDPDAPKKPPSSFILFFQEKKNEYQKKNPSLSITEITKLIGKAWNSLTEDKQNQFKNKALNLKTTYQKEYEIYAKKKGITIPQKRKVAAPQQKPKQIQNIQENQEDDDDVEIQEIDDDEVEVQQEEDNEVDEVEAEEEVEAEPEEVQEEDEEESNEQMKQSLKKQQAIQGNKKNVISQQTASNIKQHKIKLIGQTSDDEGQAKKKVKK